MSGKKVEGSSGPAIRRDGILSMADLQKRSIPSMVDGFKPVQRKILFIAFKKNLVKDTIVSQLSASVSKSNCYDGMRRINNTIFGMAHHFVGSNNINLLVPQGHFGTRYMGGKDTANAQYMYTRLSPITRVLFPKDDDLLLNYLNEDGNIIEPTWYMPIIPTVLVNGSEAKGTGWSSFIPNYNPRDIVANIRRLLNGESMVPMDPWYRGFKGTIKKDVGSTYTCNGLYEEVNDTCIRITELPIRKWSHDYEQFMTSLPLIKHYKIHTATISIEFELKLTKENMEAARKEGFLKAFQLTKTISTSNMHLFDKDGVLKKYATPEQILEEFFKLRLEYYERRKETMLQNLKLELLKLNDKVRYIHEVVNGELILMTEAEIFEWFRVKGFTPLPKKATPVDAAAAGAIDDAAEESSMAPVPSSTAFVPGSEYDYLTDMPISAFTCKKSQELLAEGDKIKEAVRELEKTEPRSLWRRDLEALDKELDKLELKDREAKEKIKEIMAMKARREKARETEGRKQPAKKAIEPESSNSAMDTETIEASKAIALDDDDDDDDVVVEVPPAKGGRKPAESKAAKPPAAASRKRGPEVVAIGVSPEKKVRQMRSNN